ncbi:MAG: aminomethyl-transferring glycine dehydrogenase subunit GcvPA [Desulfatirhabdiaceae bacterium]
MRYFPHTPEEIDQMLQVIGLTRLDDLFAGIPKTCQKTRPMNLTAAWSEWELNDHMDAASDIMAVPPAYTAFLGAGRYHHHIPAVVTALKGRTEFLTSYTPYQPEISQGALQAIYEYQTLVARLVGVDVVTASHYDGATAMAEAALMAVRITQRTRIAASALIHPFYLQVLRTYLKPTGCQLIEISRDASGRTDPAVLADVSGLAAVIVQSPNFLGCIEPVSAFSDVIHDAGGLCISGFTEALSCGLLKSPGSQGADIVFGEGQSFGLPCAFGGPGLGMLGTSKAYMRNLPGRLVGKTHDLDGKPGFVLTLATREQHIRREKATSNICSNNSHCALTAAIYMAALGGTGIRKLAEINHSKAAYLKAALKQAGMTLPFDAPFFNEFVVRFPDGFDRVYDRLIDQRIIAGLALEPFYPELKSHYLLTVTETMNRKSMDALVREVSA